jgi:alpha-D-xyloside xylohydrolase
MEVRANGFTSHYEQGKYSKISFSWDESAGTLTIGNRSGDFPVMLKNRTFNIVWVSPGNGTGTDPSKKSVAIQYSGKELKAEKK